MNAQYANYISLVSLFTYSIELFNFFKIFLFILEF